jgi:hypothetical protein
MLDITTLFSLNDFIRIGQDDYKYLNVIDPSNAGLGMHMGHPAIGIWLGSNEYSTVALRVLFPSTRLSELDHDFTARGDHVIVKRSPAPILENHKIVSVESLNTNHLTSILEALQCDGGITFLIPEKQGAMETYHTMTHMLAKFHYQTLVGYELSGNVPPMEETPVGLITFFALDQAIPIFNTKKTDGFGVMFRVVYPEESMKRKRLLFKFAIAMVAANHKDNLLVVDGVTLRTSGSVPSALAEKVKTALNSTLKKGEVKKATGSFVETKGRAYTLTTLTFDGNSTSQWTTGTSSSTQF